MHPTIFFDPAFVVNIIAGWFLTAGGVFLLLVAGIWSSVAEEQWLRGTPKPTAWQRAPRDRRRHLHRGPAMADGRLLPNRRPHLLETRRGAPPPFRCLPPNSGLRRRSRRSNSGYSDALYSFTIPEGTAFADGPGRRRWVRGRPHDSRMPTGDRAGDAVGAGGRGPQSPSRPATQRHSGEGMGTAPRVTGTESAVVGGPLPPAPTASPARPARYSFANHAGDRAVSGA